MVYYRTKKDIKMKLYRKDIGIPFVNQSVSGVYPYKFSDEVLSGWFDITSIVSADLYGSIASDYVRATFEMWLLFDAKEGTTESEKWSNCDIDEQTAVARRHIVNDKNLRLQVFTVEQDEYNFLIHADSSINCRFDRIENVKIKIGYLLNVPDRIDLFSSVDVMLDKYINVNDSSLTEWMHDANGFLSKSYYSQEIENVYVQVVELGLY